MSTLPLTPHKRDMLRAWLDGKTIQLRDVGQQWVDWGAQHPPLFLDPDDYYRIKPEPGASSAVCLTPAALAANSAVLLARRSLAAANEQVAAAYGPILDDLFDRNELEQVHALIDQMPECAYRMRVASRLSVHRVSHAETVAASTNEEVK